LRHRDDRALSAIGRGERFSTNKADACAFDAAGTDHRLVVLGGGSTDSVELVAGCQYGAGKEFAHKAALAETHISTAAARQARSPLLPKITFTESAMRGNDPVFVFGSRLRQQNFTRADLALNQLNTPTPISNFSTRFSGQWNRFDGLQSWYGVSRDRYMKQAAEQQLDRSDKELVYQAVRAYYGALLAHRQVQVAEAGLETAQAIEASSRGRVGKRHGGRVEPVKRAGSDGSTQAGTDRCRKMFFHLRAHNWRSQLGFLPALCLNRRMRLPSAHFLRFRWLN